MDSSNRQLSGKRPASLRVLAARCGVSAQTVSRVLRDPASHSAATVKAVLQVAEELGYQPNLAARAMQGGRARTVGVLGDWGAPLVLAGIHDCLTEHEFVPIILTSGMNDREQVHRLVQRRVDGIIVRPRNEDICDATFAEVWRYHVPLVAVDTHIPGTRKLAFVGTDEVLGGRIAAEHLLQLGHRRIATWVHDQSFPSSLHLRTRSFVDTIAAAGPSATCRTLVCHHNEFPARAGELLQMEATAIFVASDLLMVFLYHLILARGLRIPRDVSLVGYSDEPCARVLYPQLTTIRQEHQKVGYTAAELLCDKILRGERSGVSHSVLLEPQLVVRGSTAPATTAKA